MSPGKAREAQILGFTDKQLETTWKDAKEELAFIEKERFRREVVSFAKGHGCSEKKASFILRKARGLTTHLLGGGTFVIEELDPDDLPSRR